MSGHAVVLLLSAVSALASAVYVLATGRKSTSVTWSHGQRYVEHEKPRFGRAVAGLASLGAAIVFLVAMTHGGPGRTAQHALAVHDRVLTTYQLWATRIGMPIILLFVAFLVGATLFSAGRGLWERDWGDAVAGLVGAAFCGTVFLLVGSYWVSVL